MKISYLVTCHNETGSLYKCLLNLCEYKGEEDEILVLDDFSDDPKTQEILKVFSNTGMIYKGRVIQHALDKNYGAHKNYGNEQCTGNWVFQIDGDEVPNPNLIINIKDIIQSNPMIELIYVPRINDFIGVTEEDAKQWGWRLTSCAACENRPVVNWPDFQSRLYLRAPDRIRWDRRLHEKIEGHNGYATLPADTDLALYHDKTIETQLKTNKRYNEWFTQEENRGHNVFGTGSDSMPPYNPKEKRFISTIIKDLGKTKIMSLFKNSDDHRQLKIGSIIPLADPDSNRDFSVKVTKVVEEKRNEWIFECEEIT